jgi:hypothetical protein
VQATEDGKGLIRYSVGEAGQASRSETFPELPITGLGGYSGRAAWFFSTLEPGDKDGILLIPAPTTEDLQLTMWAAGIPVPASFVFRGPDLVPAESMPLELGTGDAFEMARNPELENGPPDQPLFAWLWKNLDPATIEIELNADTEANLKGLGYFGD